METITKIEKFFSITSLSCVLTLFALIASLMIAGVFPKLSSYVKPLSDFISTGFFSISLVGCISGLVAVLISNTKSDISWFAYALTGVVGNGFFLWVIYMLTGLAPEH